MTLPGMTKNKDGTVTPGDMLIITAGNHPIYGRQILYFIDPVFSARAKVPAPGVGEGFPRGLSDSIYWPMPIGAAGDGPGPAPGPQAPAGPPKEAPAPFTATDYEAELESGEDEGRGLDEAAEG
jgi:hypothetical protein